MSRTLALASPILISLHFFGLCLAPSVSFYPFWSAHAALAPHEAKSSFHTDRVTRCHRDYCHPDWFALTCHPKGSVRGVPNVEHQQPQAVGTRRDLFYGCKQAAPFQR